MARMTAEEFPVVNDLFSFLHNTMRTFINDTSTDIVTAITPAASACGVIVIMFYGFMLMRGSIQSPLIDATYKMLRIIIISGIALNVGVYQNYVVDFLMHAPGRMAAVITGGSDDAGSEYAAPITNFLVASFNLGDRIWAEATTFDFSNYIMGTVVYGMGIILGAYTAFLFALGNIATAILLALGPIFILLSVFESGKRFTEMWLQQVLNFGLIIIIAAATLSFFLSSADTVATEAIKKTSRISTIDVTTFSIITAIGILVLRQVMPIASGLAGGMALSTQGAFGAASRAIGRAIGATTQKLSPGNLAESYRRNQRNGATLLRMAGDLRRNPVQTAAKLSGGSLGSAVATAYKRKYEPRQQPPQS
jgi:type IV secretion system protein VirB6